MDEEQDPDDAPEPAGEIRLPFVKTLAKPNDDGSRRDFWAVEPSNDYGHDCLVGSYYGRPAVAEMRRLGTGWLLQDIVLAMLRHNDRRHRPLIIGFCSEIERALVAPPPARPAPVPGGGGGHG
ncbi:hypothetical protein [Arenibaculum sp.]|uniref:hypothetical protein n=1 Tax=Arenibaculum sp. TaxID=2865862 RepID=UPI002E119E84|nr:hypothetical protein [Arenibaculum sp.]